MLAMIVFVCANVTNWIVVPVAKVSFHFTSFWADLSMRDIMLGLLHVMAES